MTDPSSKNYSWHVAPPDVLGLSSGGDIPYYAICHELPGIIGQGNNPVEAIQDGERYIPELLADVANVEFPETLASKNLIALSILVSADAVANSNCGSHPSGLAARISVIANQLTDLVNSGNLERLYQLHPFDDSVDNAIRNFLSDSKAKTQSNSDV